MTESSSRSSTLADPIRYATSADAEAICSIYNPYVAGTIVTFEEQEVSADVMKSRIAEAKASAPWLVYETEGQVRGYAYATPWRPRSAYRFSVETTIYLAPGYEGQGMGAKLYTQLLRMLSEAGMHVAIGGIALPNARSVALHEKLGFAKVARFAEVGCKFGQWVDVGYWQRRL